MSLDLQTIGNILKKKREEKGLTIVNISDSLCLRKVIIKAIEDGDWASLPHEVYVRGYVKEYAQLLHLTEDLLGTEEHVPETQGSQKVQEAKQAKTPPSPAKKEKSKQPHQRVGRKAIVYPLVFVLIIAFFVLNQIYKERSVSRAVPTETTQTQQAAATARTPASTEPKQALPELSDARKLMVTCVERTWISVVIDGAEKKEFMLNPGEMVILNARENFDLLIGNAAGVKLNLNGQEVGLTGQSGEVKRIKVS